MGKRGPKPKNPIDRFWSKVAIKEQDECWLWTASKDRKGYGWFGVKGNKVTRAPRFALMLKLGRGLGKRECALHHCDNPSCVNPKHLFVGTISDNNLDKIRKGRSSGPYPKMSQVKINQLVKMHKTRQWTQRQLGEIFGLHQGQISRILNARVCYIKRQ